MMHRARRLVARCPSPWDLLGITHVYQSWQGRLGSLDWELDVELDESGSTCRRLRVWHGGTLVVRA